MAIRPTRAIGEPRPAYDSPETPEGHGVRYDKSYEVIGVTIVNAKWWLEKEGEIRVIFPQTPAVADTREVEAAPWRPEATTPAW